MCKLKLARRKLRNLALSSTLVYLDLHLDVERQRELLKRVKVV
jgi:hypothetical protein